MKRRAYLSLLLFLISFLFGFKGGNGFTIEIDNSFAVATKSSEVDTVAERLNMDIDEVSSYFKNNALKLIAVSKDTKTQIKVSSFADNFSSTVYDAENLSEENLSEIVSLYSSSYVTAIIVENAGRSFAKITEVLKDSGGVYTSTQYITVAGGRTFIITCQNPGETTSGEVEKIFSTFTAKNMEEKIEKYAVRKKWIVPGIIVMCGIVGISVISICKRLYQK